MADRQFLHHFQMDFAAILHYMSFIKTYLTNLLVLLFGSIGLAGGSNGLQCACSPPTSCGGNAPLTFGE